MMLLSAILGFLGLRNIRQVEDVYFKYEAVIRVRRNAHYKLHYITGQALVLDTEERRRVLLAPLSPVSTTVAKQLWK